MDVLHLLSWRGIAVSSASSHDSLCLVVDDERDELDRESDAITTTRVYIVRRSLANPGAGGRHWVGGAPYTVEQNCGIWKHITGMLGWRLFLRDIQAKTAMVRNYEV